MRGLVIVLIAFVVLGLSLPAAGSAALPIVNRLDPGSVTYGWPLVNTGQTGGTPDADVDADEAWTASTGAGVTVAVVDSGIDHAHPDLAPNIVAAGQWDFSTNTDQPTDVDGHGTMVASIIAAAANGSGLTGVAPDAKLVDLRVNASSHSIPATTVDSALARAGDLGIRIVNASLSGVGDDTVERAAIASHPGTLYVASAGNLSSDDDTDRRYPCAFPLDNIICVGSSDANDQLDPYSDYGATTVDLFAPGAHVLSDVPTSFVPDPGDPHPGLISYSGTSGAAAMVSGAAALIASLHPDWGPVQIKQRLLDTVDPVPAFHGLSVSGGRLNAARAVGVPVGPPQAPQGLAAKPGIGSVTLSWAPNSESDLAGYRVHVPGAAAPLETTGTTQTLPNLAPGIAVQVSVSAVDRAGYESSATSVTATPPAAARVVPPPALGKAVLHGRPCRARCKTTLRFSLTKAAKVRFTLRRAGHRATVKTHAYRAGSHSLSMHGRVLGTRLSKGRWTLKVAIAGSNTRTLRFTVRH